MPEHPDGQLVEALQRGLRQMAHVADGSANLDYVQGRAIPWEELRPIIDSATGRISTAAAYEHFLVHIATAKCRSYELPTGGSEQTVISYAYTKNNQRELVFLQQLIEEIGVPFDVFNVCDATPVYRVGVDEGLSASLVAAVQQFLADRPDIAPGLLNHLCKYATSVQGAHDTLTQTTSRTFATANDHSPAPVAYATIARFLGHRVMYLQHAEVSSIFPPLDFDLSVLRNQRSARVYSSIGPARGEVVVAARSTAAWTSWEGASEKQGQLAQQATANVVLYPSSVVEVPVLESLLSGLAANPDVGSVAVKPHPNTRHALTESAGPQFQILQQTPSIPHVAVCGNSSMVIELLEQGCLVFQDFSLDNVARDYYSFVADGLTRELPAGYAINRFWNSFTPLDTTQGELLANYLPRLDTPRNREAGSEVEPALLKFLLPLPRTGPAPTPSWFGNVRARFRRRHTSGAP